MSSNEKGLFNATSATLLRRPTGDMLQFLLISAANLKDAAILKIFYKQIKLAT